MSWSSIKRKCKPINDPEDIKYATGCMKKKRFPDWNQANSARASMVKRYRARDFNVYECKFCDGFHVGSIN